MFPGTSYDPTFDDSLRRRQVLQQMGQTYSPESALLGGSSRLMFNDTGGGTIDSTQQQPARRGGGQILGNLTGLNRTSSSPTAQEAASPLAKVPVFKQLMTARSRLQNIGRPQQQSTTTLPSGFGTGMGDTGAATASPDTTTALNPNIPMPPSLMQRNAAGQLQPIPARTTASPQRLAIDPATGGIILQDQQPLQVQPPILQPQGQYNPNF